jgi:hypothetical protein
MNKLCFAMMCVLAVSGCAVKGDVAIPDSAVKAVYFDKDNNPLFAEELTPGVKLHRAIHIMTQYSRPPCDRSAGWRDCSPFGQPLCCKP